MYSTRKFLCMYIFLIKQIQYIPQMAYDYKILPIFSSRVILQCTLYSPDCIFMHRKPNIYCQVNKCELSLTFRKQICISSPGVPSTPVPPRISTSTHFKSAKRLIACYKTCPLKITKTSNEKRGSRERKQLAACESVGAARGPTMTRLRCHMVAALWIQLCLISDPSVIYW